MKQLALGKRPVVVTTVSGLILKMCPLECWRQGCFVLQAGEEFSLDKLLAKLADGGYERTEMTEVEGQVSVRGGIVDIFPVGEEKPYRLEFFGDIIDSIRIFDPVTQRSEEQLPAIQLMPAREIFLGEEQWERAQALLTEELERLAAGGKVAEPLIERLQEHREKIAEHIYFTGIEQYLPYFYERPAAITDWFAEDALLLLNDPVRCEQAAEQLAREMGELLGNLLAQGDLLAGQAELTWSYAELLGKAKQKIIAFSLFGRQSGLLKFTRTFSLTAKPVPHFLGQWQLFAQEVAHWRQQGYRVAILTTSRQRSSRLAEILAERNIPAYYALSHPELLPKSVTLLHGSLETGFVMPEAKLAVLTEQDIMPQRKKKRRIKSKEGIRIGDYQELQVGNYVVHEHHGIGQYLGIRTLEVGGVSQDYLFKNMPQ